MPQGFLLYLLSQHGQVGVEGRWQQSPHGVVKHDLVHRQPQLLAFCDMGIQFVDLPIECLDEFAPADITTFKIAEGLPVVGIVVLSRIVAVGHPVDLVSPHEIGRIGGDVLKRGGCQPFPQLLIVGCVEVVVARLHLIYIVLERYLICVSLNLYFLARTFF